MQNIFQAMHDDKQEKGAGVLAKFRETTAFAVEMAKAELPRSEEAFFRIDAYKKETFGTLPESELPNNIRQVLGQIEQVRSTPSTVRSALAERERVQVKDLTPQKAPFVTANFLTRLSFARGLADSVERHFTRLKLEVDRFRSLHDETYDAPKNETRRQATI